MTDFSDTGPADRGRASDDEVVSAYLDGEATPAEIERVEAESALTARLDRFAEISGRVRDVPAAPPGVVDGHVAAALADFDPSGTVPSTDPDTDAGTAGDPAGSGTVVDRRDRSFWRRPLGAVAAAAAVVLVVVGVIGLARSAGDRDAADTATRAVPEDTGGTGATDDAATEEDLDASAAAPEAATAPRLRFSSDETLADYLRDQLDANATTGPVVEDGADDDRASDDAGSTQADGAEASQPSAASEPPAVDDPDPCGAVELLGIDPDTVVTVVPVLVETRPVTAVVHVPDDVRRLVVVDDETCTVTVDRAL